MTLTCSYCRGAWHPATGAWFTETWRQCGPCVRAFYAWYRTHTATRKRRPSFYDAALLWKNVGK